MTLRNASFSVGAPAPEATPEEDDEAAFAPGPGPTVLTGLNLQVRVLPGCSVELTCSQPACAL